MLVIMLRSAHHLHTHCMDSPGQLRVKEVSEMRNVGSEEIYTSMVDEATRGNNNG